MIYVCVWHFVIVGMWNISLNIWQGQEDVKGQRNLGDVQIVGVTSKNADTNTVINLGKLQRAHCSRSLEIIVIKGNHPQMALIQVSELLLFAQKWGEQTKESEKN